MALRVVRRPTNTNTDILYNPNSTEAKEARRLYGGSVTDYDNDGVSNVQDVNPFQPGVRSGPAWPGGSGTNAPNPGSPGLQQQTQTAIESGGRVAQEAAARREAAKRAQQEASRRGSMEEFFAQMQQIMQGSAPAPMQYTGPSNQELLGRSQMLAAQQYDPQIQAIARMMQETEGRAARNETELGNLYSALAGAYESDIPKVQQTYQGAIDQSNQQQASLQQALASDYGARNSAMDELARSLGQEQAGDVVGEQLSADQAFLQNLERQVGTSQLGALQQMQAVNTEYTRQGANLARGEGTSRRSDLRADLEDYIRSSQGKITDLGSQREATASAQYMQMLAQAEEARQQVAMQNTSQQNQWRSGQFGNMMDLFQMRMAMDKAMQPEQPGASDILGAERLQFDQENALRNWVMELAKTSGLKGQELVDFINQYMQQLGM